MKFEIMDTTLRDGEQTSGVTFTEIEKLNIAQMLLAEINIDRIEIASARVSEGEFNAAKKIIDWAKENGFHERVEILGFVDKGRSLDWIRSVDGKVINLLCKGSLKHVTEQLRKTPEEHVADIRQTLDYAAKLGIMVNVYFEDWSNGMKDSPDYVYFLTDELKDSGILRFMLPDTLGILTPDETSRFCKMMTEKYPGLHFDFHAHNDYDLAVANSLAAIRAGFRGVHTTVNGLGERAGNATLSSVVAAVNDHGMIKLSVNEKKLNKMSRLVEAYSGVRIPSNKPIIGDNVFTQTCGVHADGDSKGNLYHNCLTPDRFGRIRKYALGKTSGKASIKKNLEELGIDLDQESIDKVTKRVIELGDRKERITTEDLPYIISDVLGSKVLEDRIQVVNYYIGHAKGLRPVATVRLSVNGEEYEETASGDGQFDAFMRALKNIYKRLKKEVATLIDYVVTIPPGGKTDALVETVITWNYHKEFRTRGLDSDQTAAAIKAAVKMLNVIENVKE